MRPSCLTSGETPLQPAQPGANTGVDRDHPPHGRGRPRRHDRHDRRRSRGARQSAALRVPEQLFWLYTDNPPYRFRFSVVDYRALEADHPAFSAVAAYQTSNVTVTDGGAAERVTAKVVTGSYFP